MTRDTPDNKPDSPPQLYVIAGPNGVGKTTFAMTFLPEAVGCCDFLNADEIARGLSPLAPEAAAFKAGRILLTELRGRIQSRRSFALETTLSGRAYVKHLMAAREAGFEINMIFLWVPSVRITINRVRERVHHGGHNIPQSVSERRFPQTVRNLFDLYWQHLDFVAIFDSSGAPPRQVYERDGDRETIIDPETYKVIRQMAGKYDT
ncbi:MAG: AAA family ATPase [Lentisphaeria bacterium]|nr:AAA family ATPase [Lentisphaeria bacterium]